jgi:hypothetical protein
MQYPTRKKPSRKQKDYYFLAEIQLGAKTIKSLFDVTLESFDSAERRELVG